MEKAESADVQTQWIAKHREQRLVAERLKAFGQRAPFTYQVFRLALRWLYATCRGTVHAQRVEMMDK